MERDEETSEAPVTVAVVFGRGEALVIQAKLAEAGVRSYLRYESLQSAYPLTVNGLGQVEVQVASKDAKRARKVLETPK
ncbi:MAG: hypothetical protein C4521_09245 [Actinobacteria bacterium]|nr:MAG: hypothetical protein C4521_09245 [Actinomycetota bacterium]